MLKTNSMGQAMNFRSTNPTVKFRKLKVANRFLFLIIFSAQQFFANFKRQQVRVAALLRPNLVTTSERVACWRPSFLTWLCRLLAAANNNN